MRRRPAHAAIKGRWNRKCVRGYKQDEHVLNGISFTASRQTIAIVGRRGWKNTMINLIPRFYDVTGGAVLIDGLDVRNVTAESLRPPDRHRLAGHLPVQRQCDGEYPLWAPEASDEEVLAAAKLAHADSFIERLPDGYQTVLGERGSGLSQGQRQCWPLPAQPCLIRAS